MAPPTITPLVIVGGGEVGLTASILLSLQGIEHVLFERHPSTSMVPKAISVHNRTMEILRKTGLDDEIWKIAAPFETYRRTAWWTSLGPGGREIASREAFGYVLSESERGKAYANASPSAYACLAQLRLEPLLKRRAEDLNPSGIFFNHEVDGVNERGDAVTVTYHDRSSQLPAESSTIEAKFVIAADGGRFLTDHLGVGWDGVTIPLADMVTAHIRAPISRHLSTQDNLIYWFINPESGGSVNSGAIYHLGPYDPASPETEEWSLAFGRLPHERGKPFSAQDVKERARAMLKIPELEESMEVLSISFWNLQAKWAKSYISPKGKVFLVGDAAHRICPWGALGGNTGFQDVDNLVWKLALALKSSGPDEYAKLLQSYDTERRPIGRRVAVTGLANMKAHSGILDRAIGIRSDASASDNINAMRSYFAEKDIGAGERHEAVRQAVEKLDVEFYALGAEAGWFYDYSDVYNLANRANEGWRSSQINPDGSFENCEYRPTTMPGHQLPHAWLTHLTTGEKVSTRWLVPRDRFLLLTSDERWRKAEGRLIKVAVVGGRGATEWEDRKGEWERQREVEAGGAVLVRPDCIVGWRWKVLEENGEELGEEVRRVVRVLKSG